MVVENPQDSLKKLEYVSLVSKVCTEIKSHIENGDNVLQKEIEAEAKEKHGGDRDRKIHGEDGHRGRDRNRRDRYDKYDRDERHRDRNRDRDRDNDDYDDEKGILGEREGIERTIGVGIRIRIDMRDRGEMCVKKKMVVMVKKMAVVTEKV
ncbi:hypothetical protein S83_017228 [Arachis hypogaea]